VSIISVVRTQRFPWEQVTGFMGERRHDEGRVHLILVDERHIPLPGTLDPAELDPYGDEGALLSAADQLNLFKARAVSGEISKPAVPIVHVSPTLSDHPTRREQRHERKALRAALKAVQPAPEGRPEPAPVALDPPRDDPSRKERRSERKALRAALKAVRLTPDGEVALVVPSDDEQIPSRRLGRRSRRRPAPELTEVTIGEGEPVPVAGPARAMEEPTTGLASHYPTPVYIPQAEYARMLREQKAAEKAAVAAAAELRRLAESGELDELAAKQEFSDWTS
jgi:hypothetical protein